MLTLEQRVHPHPDVVDTEVGDGEVALLHLTSKHYYSLNATGGRIWQGLTEGLDLAAISQRLQAEYKISPERANQSVLTLVSTLLERELITLD
jgi:hypothetical protein